MSVISGHKIIPITGEEGCKLIDDFEGDRFGVIRLVPDNWFIPAPYLEFAEKIYNFKCRSTDVAVMSFPKCGSTWMQEIVWMLTHSPDLDNPKADVPIYFRSPALEGDFFAKCSPYITVDDGAEIVQAFVNAFPDRNPEDGISYQLTELADDPRVFKTHLPFDLLPPSLLDTSRVIYTCREPKDVAVSYYKFAKVYKTFGFLGTMDSLVDHLINNRLTLGPFWSHVKQAWEKRDHPNMLFVHYEDINSNPKAEITRISKFLGLNLTEKQIDNVVEYTSFSAMKKRDNLFQGDKDVKFLNHENLKKEGGFFNKGKIGTWKERLTEEQVEKINEWSRKNVEKLDGDFKYKKNYF